MSRHQGKRQRRHLARKAARRRAKAVLRELETRAVETRRGKAKQAAHEAMLDQIALDKLNGLEEGYICRAHYRKLCAQERVVARPRRKARRARPPATYRHARRRDMAKRRAEQRGRITWTMPPAVPPYNRAREMARRRRQQMSRAPQLMRAA